MTIESQSGAWIGIPASTRLQADVDRVVNNIRDNLPERQDALLADVMKRFLDEAIDTLITGMCDAVNLHGVSRKTVDVTVATVRTTCHMLAGRVLRGLKNDELRALAEHMDDLRMATPGRNGGAAAWTVVPLPPALLADIVRLQAAVHEGSPRPHMPAIQAMLGQFVEVVVEHFYVRTLATLRLGPIARKVVEMGYRTVHSGVNGLVHRVVPQLSDEQVRDAADFIVNLIVHADGTGVQRCTQQQVPA